MNLELVSKNNPILHKVTEKFDFNNPQVNPKEFAEDLHSTMIRLNGMGLAAPQVGYSLSVFSIMGAENYVFFNPKIVWQSVEESKLEEGCLTYPNVVLKVKRAMEIRVRFQDYLGTTHTKKFTGLTAKVIQHELDHLNATTLVDHMTLYHKEKFKKKGLI